ncbi:hypothetical protein [Nostoc sp. UHCC 0251]|uniref:hypothetical protein n=1 Tax=Nostoc sp. UHCC 0251 TaxID=3110240 RepID=UPI002B20A8A8|nr:hypothetical protein [Nostoc sp. UHCC 0251]MEA5626122.1 hypothetical protein [Nostoc sp. UHCC 0251]
MKKRIAAAASESSSVLILTLEFFFNLWKSQYNLYIKSYIFLNAIANTSITQLIFILRDCASTTTLGTVETVL